MARGTVTPWRSQRDLLEVRKQLYRLDESAIQTDERHNAVQRVMAWKARGNLPHAVESTALLMDAILHHDNSDNSTFSVRAVYSAAFTRFVTGFCDIGRSKERLLEPSSMLEIAKQIDMPVDFVTLRHEATHQELPEIHRLVRATEDALDWLWTVYWSRLEDGGASATDAESLGKLKSEAKQLLRGFRSSKREALRAGRQDGHEGDQLSWKTSKACVELMGQNTAQMNAFTEVLLQDKLLVPSKRGLGSPLDGAFLIWDRLLQEVFKEQTRFLRNLVNAMLSSLSSPATADVDAEAYCLWLMHIIERKAWSFVTPAEKAIIQRHIMIWCCTHSAGKWTKHLGTLVVASSDLEFQQDWREIFQSSQLEMENLEPRLEKQAEARVPHNDDPCVTDDGEIGKLGDSAIATGLPAEDFDPGDARARWMRQTMRPSVSLGVLV